MIYLSLLPRGNDGAELRIQVPDELFDIQEALCLTWVSFVVDDNIV